MFEDYLRELQRVTLLRPEEESALWRAFRADGDLAGRRRLIEAYQPLVFKIVMGLRPPASQLMDMIQEGCVGLIESVERFDPGRGVRFSTFAAYRIRGRVLNALARIRVDLSLDQVLATPDDAPAVAGLIDPATAAALGGVEDRALVAQMLAVIEHFPLRERAVLTAVANAREPRVIARELEISLSHFYRLQKQAVARLRALLQPDGMHQPERAPGY